MQVTNTGEILRRILKTLTESIFPSKCLACGLFFHPESDKPKANTSVDQWVHDPIETLFQRVMSPFLCSRCLNDFSPVSSPLCTRCGRMFKTGSGTAHQCGNCIQNPSDCSMVRAAGIYHGSLKSVIHGLKYKNKAHLARPLGRLLFAAFMKYYDIYAIDCILPVPLHNSRLKQRGFNQAAMLVMQWRDFINKMTAGRSVLIDCSNLARKRKTLSQTGLGREKRKQNVKGAFILKYPSKISGKQVLLVDDVYTTGSTSNECARTLIAGGAETVSVLTLARAD